MKIRLHMKILLIHQSARWMSQENYLQQCQELKRRISSCVIIRANIQDKRVDLKQVSEFIGYGHLSFCSSECLLKYLGVEPRSVYLLGILNDKAGEVEILINEDLWEEQYLLCHPLVNMSTLRLGRDELVKLFRLRGHLSHLLPIHELNE